MTGDWKGAFLPPPQAPPILTASRRTSGRTEAGSVLRLAARQRAHRVRQRLPAHPPRRSRRPTRPRPHRKRQLPHHRHPNAGKMAGGEGEVRKRNAEAQSTQRKTQRKSDKGLLDKGMLGWRKPGNTAMGGRIGFQPVMENGLPACFAQRAAHERAIDTRSPRTNPK